MEMGLQFQNCTTTNSGDSNRTPRERIWVSSGNWFEPATIVALHDSEHPSVKLATIRFVYWESHSEGENGQGGSMHGKLLTLHRHVGYMYVLPPLSHKEILRDMSTSGGKQVDGTVSLHVSTWYP